MPKPPSPVLELEESESFEALFRTYAPFVWRVLGRLGVATEDLPDASQDVFLVVARRLEDFEGRSSVKTWIYGICLKVASTWRKRAARSTRQPWVEPASSAGGQEQEVERRRARERLMRVLQDLDENKRAVFVLYELEELSMPEIAEALGCPLTTAYSRLHAARKAVRSAFARRQLAEQVPS